METPPVSSIQHATFNPIETLATVHTHLALGVAVAILVLVPECKLLREVLLDLLVHHLLAHALRETHKSVKDTHRRTHKAE